MSFSGLSTGVSERIGETATLISSVENGLPHVLLTPLESTVLGVTEKRLSLGLVEGSRVGSCSEGGVTVAERAFAAVDGTEALGAITGVTLLLVFGVICHSSFGAGGGADWTLTHTGADEAGAAGGFGAGFRNRRGSSSSSMWKRGGQSNAGCSDRCTAAVSSGASRCRA
jgi:hypothetical protein